MARSSPWLKVLSTLALCSSLAVSQDVLPLLSFGQSDKISPHAHSIPNWHLAAENHAPQILSDRVILTPPAPGHVRAFLWADNANQEQQWTAEVAFCAGGQERGSGNFQIWDGKDGRAAGGTNSVYTVPLFEGLVLTVDQHGGRGGMLRGFLNDGTTNYRDHHMVDTLAFGHCDFPYRNLGRSSKIQVTSDSWGLQVMVDGQPCFSSQRVSLPAGYYFGMTAATSDDPDSFEVNSFAVTKATNRLHQATQDTPRTEQKPIEGQRMPNAPEQIPDVDASAIQKQQEQFSDVHNRLQSLSHQINGMFGEFEKISRKIDEKHNDLVAKTPRSSEDSINALIRRIEGLEKSIRDMQKDLSNQDYSTHLTAIHRSMEGLKGGISDNLPDTLHQRKSNRYTGDPY